jgi:tetratricopeptide (TPR) repeat protein
MQARPEYAHSEYLNTLADYGVAGAILAAAGLASLLASAVLSRKYVERGSGDLGDKGSNRFAFFVGATLGLAGLAIHAIGEFPMHIPALGLLAMVLAGQVASLARFASDRWWFTPRAISKTVASVVILAALAPLAPAAWQAFREARALAKAHGESTVNAEFIRALESAAAIAPGNPHTALILGEGLRQASFFGGSEWTARRPDAFAWLEKAAALNPHDPKPPMALAEAWAWEQDLDKALAQSAKARALAPRFVAAANLHGWVLFQRGQFREAREQFQQSLAWDPWSNHFAQAYLAACNNALGTPPPQPKP